MNFLVLIEALGNMARLDVLAIMVVGIFVGLLFGVIPGISGITAISILLSFMWGMDPVLALTFILAVNSATSQGGSVTSILLNVPGDATNAATLLDGYPMAQKGMASRALGIVLTGSAVGGLFGGLVLLSILPVMKVVVMSFGSPETFMLILLGLIFTALIARTTLLKGFIAGCLGLILSFFGLQQATAVSRFDFNCMYMEDGIQLIPLILGIFAIPEVIDMMVEGETSVQSSGFTQKASDTIEGVKDVFRNIGLTLRCSTIGTIVGFVPGLGAGAATFMAYAHAKQTSKHPEQFGTGAIEGVIGPESASNAKEGSALVTTLGFGIPASAGTALLLSGFLVVGIQPGPKMLTENLHLSVWLGWTAIIANVGSSFLMLLTARQMTKILYLHVRFLGPLVLAAVAIGSFSNRGTFLDVLMTFAFGAIGYGAAKAGYPRVPIVLGFILGKMAETYFLISVSAFGPFFFLKPISLCILAVILLTVAYEIRSRIRLRRKGVIASA
ncbi:MAG: tripartite tricarboxylate transporter permease [Deltaproteobacteria bacterium]|nr:MAG: tripartite tricarboxylate transporter permease [Deltaproteobacteria bacterium]